MNPAWHGRRNFYIKVLTSERSFITKPATSSPCGSKDYRRAVVRLRCSHKSEVTPYDRWEYVFYFLRPAIALQCIINPHNQRLWLHPTYEDKDAQSSKKISSQSHRTKSRDNTSNKRTCLNLLLPL